MSARKALLLIGSPKGKASASWAVGNYLLRKLETGGMETEETFVSAALRTPESRNDMLAAVDAADLVIVSFPLYIDQLPAPLIQVLELIADHQKAKAVAARGADPHAGRLAAIVHCGFPETFQNQAAVDIMKRFAGDAGFVWAGALAMGMGGAVGGKALEKAGGMVKNVVKALEASAVSLTAGGLIPESATALAGKPMMATWIYLLFANFGMKGLARKNGVGKRIHDRPYAP
jgi:hypothetical protein